MRNEPISYYQAKHDRTAMFDASGNEITVGDKVRYSEIGLGILGQYKHGIVTEITDGTYLKVQWPMYDFASKEWCRNLVKE